MNRVLHCVFVFALLATPVVAAEKLVASVPESMSWTVVATPPGVENRTESDPASRRIRIFSAYAKGLRKFSRSEAEARERLYFLTRDYILGTDPMGRVTVTAVADGSPAAASPLSPPVELAEFTEFGWVKPTHFSGTVEYAGRQCAMYQELQADPKQSGTIKDGAPSGSGTTRIVSQQTTPGTSPNQREKILQTAYIDATTRLPVALIDRSGTYRYTFKALNEPLALPSEYAAALRETEQRMEKMRLRYRIPQ
jgi:hypothetical protein